MSAAGKAVFITGASSGIGRECALRLASAGYRVFAGVRGKHAAAAWKRAAADSNRTSAGGRVEPVFIDVTDGASIAAAAEAVSGMTGEAGLYGLVNNAGISVAGPLEILPIEDLRRQFEVNVIGQIAVTQAFLPLLRKSRGRILFMGSIAGRLVLPFVGAYSGAKYALEAFSDALSMELREWGISVSIIEPGNIATPIWEKSKSGFIAAQEKMPAAGRELYRTWLQTIPNAVDGFTRGGAPPARVARAVEKALGSRRLRARYTVGWDSKVYGKLAPLLPGRLRQRLIPLFIPRM
jgi:NAD(P)-dependent dehydrogenase (short-subunit alcohol dehydrogenase family)